MIFFDKLATELGVFTAVEEDGRLTELSLHELSPGPDWRKEATPLLTKVFAQLTEYLTGRRRVFDLPLAPRGTPFQQKVWQTLRGIEYGTTINYQELAVRVGNSRACRAVGGANGKNPLLIVVPCHRVIGKDGSLTGFGAGLPVKEKLLALETGARCF